MTDYMRYLHPVPCRECLAPAGQPCLTRGKARGDHATREADRARAEREEVERETAAALLVACVYCQAQPGDPCRTTMGTIDRTQRPHSVRVTAGRRVARLAPDPAQASLL